MKTLLLFVVLGFSICAHAGQETISGSPYSVDLGAASISGAGKLIRATNVPVTVNGTTYYYDVNFDLAILPNGSLAASMTSAVPATGPAITPTQSTLGFLPGTYSYTFTSGSTYTCTLTLSTPSIGNDGRRQYVLAPTTASATNCSKDYLGGGATWLTGPAQGNPLVTGLLSTTYSPSAPSDQAYGATIYSNNGSTLITARQTANSLIVEGIYNSGSIYRTFLLTKQ